MSEFPDYSFVPNLQASEARWLLSQTHYLGDLPDNTSWIFGAFEEGKLVAVAAFGPCQAAKLPETYIELKRLTARSILQTPLSKFLAQTLRYLKGEAITAVLTWADPAVGHHGGIYQATNWIYAEPRSYCWNYSFRAPVKQDDLFGDASDYEIIDHKQAFSMFGTSSKKKVIALNPSWEAFLPPMKLRYVMPLNISEAECLSELRAVKKPYPKPRTTYIERPQYSQRSMA